MAELGSIHLHLIDGSPQWRGQGLFAGTLDLVFRQQLFRWTPLMCFGEGSAVRLDEDHGDALPDGPAHGPTHCATLPRGRSISTDGGIERLIASQRGFLDNFRCFIEEPLPRNFREHPHMFPRAVQVLGWKLQADLIIRKGVEKLAVVPAVVGGNKVGRLLLS